MRVGGGQHFAVRTWIPLVRSVTNHKNRTGRSVARGVDQAFNRAGIVDGTREQVCEYLVRLQQQES